MMKKIFQAMLVVGLLLTPVSVFAKEEASSKSLPLKSLQAGTLHTSLPFEFALDRGEWVEANPGPLFTTGTHAPELTLPSLAEAPIPIRYPRWAVQEGWQGTFVIAVEILKNGTVGRWKIMQSTGHSLLDQAAVNAIHQWHFHPATEKGQAVVSCIEIPIHFKLQE